MIGFIDTQTKWYIDKAQKLKSVTEELKKLDPLREQKRDLVIRIIGTTADFVVGLKRLSESMKALKNPMQHFGDAAGYVTGFHNIESEFVFEKRKQNYRSIIPTDEANKYSEIEKLIKQVNESHGSTRN